MFMRDLFIPSFYSNEAKNNKMDKNISGSLASLFRISSTSV